MFISTFPFASFAMIDWKGMFVCLVACNSFLFCRSRFVSKQEQFFPRCTPRNSGPQSHDSPPKRGTNGSSLLGYHKTLCSL